MSVQTPRLRLRLLVAEDFPQIHAIFGDADTVAHFPRPLTEEETRALVQAGIAQQGNGLGLYAMTLRDGDGIALGDCGILRREIEGRAELELGYHLQRAHWGRGYATEAARAVLNDARAHGHRRVVSLVRPEHAASRRVAERLGAQVEREVDWGGLPHLLYVYP